MSSQLILAIDIGTSSTRAALFDEGGHRLQGTLAQQTYNLITTADGGAELEPGVLLGAVKHCMAQTLHARRADSTLRGRPIAAVGVSCFWHSLVGVDGKGRPVTRVVTWADSRCREDAAKLRKRIPEKSVHARTGCMLRASFWPAKLTWLKRVEPKAFGQVKRWMSPAEWLQLILVGETRCALGMAAGTGLLNPTKQKWEVDLMKKSGISPEMVNPLSDEPSVVLGELGEEFPELRGVPWFPAIGDGAASNLGCGATKPGLAAINVGTSAALRVMREGKEAKSPFGLFCYRVDQVRYLVGGAVSNAGNLRSWCVRELKLPDDASIERAFNDRPGPAPGLMVLPFWTAERAPTWNEEKTGAIVGITQHTTALDLLQAITEASYQRLARIAELVLADEEKPPKFIVSGGIQRSPMALQRLADVLGHSVHANEEMEASIRGAAVYVIEKLGWATPPARFGEAVKPRAKYARLYAEARERQRELEEKL